MKEAGATKTAVDSARISRIRRIRAELISSCFGLHDEETFLFTFLDYLHLLFQPTQQSPLAFSLWHGDRCVYSSFRDLYYTADPYTLHQEQLSPPSRGIRILEEHDFWLSIHKVDTQELGKLEKERTTHSLCLSDKQLQDRVLPVAENKYFEDAFLLLRSKEEDFGARLDDIQRYKDLLVSSFEKTSRSAYPLSCVPEGITDLDYRLQMLPLLESFRDVLDEVFVGMNTRLFENHDPKLGNIFCVVRTIQSNRMRYDRFPYTAGLLLSTKQRENFKRWCSGGCSKAECQLGLAPDADCVDHFEVPLGLRSRSAADVTFCSGIIDFGRQPNDKVWDRVNESDDAEQLRVQVERCVYPHEPLQPKRKQKQHPAPSLYYIPVHVNGIPWIVLFTFTPSPSTTERDCTRWEHNFTFYRNATQKALSYIRWRAEETYMTELVSSAFGQGVSWQWPSSEIQKRVNDVWHIAARVFPFPRFSLHSMDSDSVGTHDNFAPLPRIPGRIEHWGVRVDTELTYYGKRQVEWGKVESDRLLRKLTRMMTSQISTWEHLSGAESTRAAAYSSHLLKTPINELTDRVNLVQNDEDRKALSFIVEGLHEFTTFAMATIDKRRWSSLQEGMRSLPAAKYVQFINDQTRSSLATLANKNIFGDSDTEAVARRLLQCSDVVQIDHGWDTLQGTITYHPLQTKTILIEAMANALFGLVNTDLYCSIELSLPISRDISIKFVNSTPRSSDEVDLDIERANGGSADLLGITNIRQACKALGFAAPKWFRSVSPDGYTAMGLQVMIGKYQGTSEVVL